LDVFGIPVVRVGCYEIPRVGVNNFKISRVELFQSNSGTLYVFLKNFFYSFLKKNVYNHIMNHAANIRLTPSRRYCADNEHDILLESISTLGYVLLWTV
jgi:hypothetical protein